MNNLVNIRQTSCYQSLFTKSDNVFLIRNHRKPNLDQKNVKSGFLLLWCKMIVILTVKSLYVYGKRQLSGVYEATLFPKLVH